MQHHSCKHLQRSPLFPKTLGMGSIGQSSTFSEHGSKYFAADPTIPLTLGIGSTGQNSTFSEHGHFAYKINRNHECSNTVAYILPQTPLSP